MKLTSAFTSAAAMVLLGASAATACQIYCRGKYVHQTGDKGGGCFGFDNTDAISSCMVDTPGTSYTLYSDYGCTGSTVGSGKDTTNFNYPVKFSSIKLNCGGGTCGNGVLDYGEECDDGNNMDGDGCSSVCIKEPPNHGGKCERCDPNPGANLCHPTTSCSSTPFGTMCACRPGYKANAPDNAVDTHWRLAWPVAGHEHRVYVNPGEPCDTLCKDWFLGGSGCTQVSVGAC